MFLRRYTRKKSGNSHSYYALVESVRTETGPRQRVVAHLGELSTGDERRWQRIAVFYNRQGEAEQLRLFADEAQVVLPDDPDVVRVRLGSVSWSDGRNFGDVWLGLWLWRLLKLDEIVARHIPTGQHTVAPAQIVVALVVTREGFPLAHYTLAGNTRDVQTVEKVVTAVEARFGKSERVWVMDRGMMSKDNLKFLSTSGRRYLIGTLRSELASALKIPEE